MYCLHVYCQKISGSWLQGRVRCASLVPPVFLHQNGPSVNREVLLSLNTAAYHTCVPASCQDGFWLLHPKCPFQPSGAALFTRYSQASTQKPAFAVAVPQPHLCTVCLTCNIYLFRMYCETPMNQTSSRSHCVFTVGIEGIQPEWLYRRRC